MEAGTTHEWHLFTGMLGLTNRGCTSRIKGGATHPGGESMKYKVTVYQERSSRVTFDVNANNSKEALNKAMEGDYEIKKESH